MVYRPNWPDIILGLKQLFGQLSRCRHRAFALRLQFMPSADDAKYGNLNFEIRSHSDRIELKGFHIVFLVRRMFASNGPMDGIALAWVRKIVGASSKITTELINFIALARQTLRINADLQLPGN